MDTWDFSLHQSDHSTTTTGLTTHTKKDSLNSICNALRLALVSRQGGQATSLYERVFFEEVR